MTLFHILYAPLYFLAFVGGAMILVSAGVSSFWLIVLLGTAQFRSSDHIRAGQVGIAGRANYPEAYLAQLPEPFRGTLPEASRSPSQSSGRS